jgi:hypothetical protein
MLCRKFRPPSFIQKTVILGSETCRAIPFRQLQTTALNPSHRLDCLVDRALQQLQAVAHGHETSFMLTIGLK